MDPFVSIIIPTFNRAPLIGETLDSVINQSYKNWECVVVDDGSSDFTAELMEFYCARDGRIKFHSLPLGKKKGGNAARNYGFELSTGCCIVWFDSDDIMLKDYLSDKIGYLNRNPHFHGVISKFKNIGDTVTEEERAFYLNSKNEINAYNFITHQNFWVTSGVILKREVIGGIRFNESLASGQEYNFFSKLMVYRDPSFHYLNSILVHKRSHNNSIQNIQKNNNSLYLRNKLTVYFQTLIEIKSSNHPELKRMTEFLLNQVLGFSFRLSIKKMKNDFLRINGLLLDEKKIPKIIFYNTSIFIAYTFGKGYFFLKLAKG